VHLLKDDSPDLLEMCRQFCGPPSRVYEYANDSQIIAYLQLGIRVEFVVFLVFMLGREVGNTL
jgi:hypothetical protein